MSRFCFIKSLKPGARRALERGTGVYRRYAVDGDRIAVIRDGVVGEWYRVIRTHGPTIREVKS